MSYVSDISGMVFGKLTVVEKDCVKTTPGGRKYSCWKCRCECGTELVVSRPDLMRGRKTSCKDCRKKDSVTDLTGRRFGRLTVVCRGDDDYYRGHARRRWICKCDCGNEEMVSIPERSLLYNGTQSCGCLNKEVVRNLNYISNEYNLTDYEYGVCYLNDGSEVLFDKEDYGKLKEYHWKKSIGNSVDHTYAIAESRRDHLGHRHFIQMHRLIKDVNDENLIIDHINHNCLDNRKTNLRIVTHSQNMQNTRLRSNNTSGFKGVSFNKTNNRWIATIVENGNYHFLGSYATKDEAIHARQLGEKKYHGEYAYKKSEDYLLGGSLNA